MASYAGSLSEDDDFRPNTRSSTPTDVSFPSEQPVRSRHSARAAAYAAATGGQPRRKIGRPIAYTGDPDSKHLTEAERRRVKRRIANRESARRVRSKRQNALEDMQAQLEHVQGHTAALVQRLKQAEEERAQLLQQLHSMHARAAAADTSVLARRPNALLQLSGSAAPPPPAAIKQEPSQHPTYSAADTTSPRKHFAMGAGTVTSGGPSDRSAAARAAALVPDGVSRPWCGAAAASGALQLSPVSVSLTPSANCGPRLHFSTGGKPHAGLQLQPQLTGRLGAQDVPLPMLQGAPLLDLQSMASADDPLGVFMQPWGWVPTSSAAMPSAG